MRLQLLPYMFCNSQHTRLHGSCVISISGKLRIQLNSFERWIPFSFSLFLVTGVDYCNLEIEGRKLQVACRISHIFNAMDVCSRPHQLRKVAFNSRRDMTTPQTSHPCVYERFASGAFAVRKSTRVLCNCHGLCAWTRKYLHQG